MYIEPVSVVKSMCGSWRSSSPVKANMLIRQRGTVVETAKTSGLLRKISG